MTRPFEILNPLNQPGWDDLVASHPNCSVFHSSAWARVLVESYAYTPHYVTVKTDGRIDAMIPLMEVSSILTGRRGVCLPFSDYCDPLLGESMSVAETMSQLIAYGKNAGWRWIEIRYGEDLPAEIEDSESLYRHTLGLERGEDEIFRGFRSNTQRNIRKAEKQGLTVSSSTSMDFLAEFYRLNRMTRKEHGLPPQPRKFFGKLHEHILKKNGGFLVLAHFRGRCVSAAVFLLFGDRAYYKYGASDKTMQHLRGNNLVMWEAIRICAKRRIRSLCFGKTERSNDGLRNFKMGWGTSESLIRYFKHDFAQGRIFPARPSVSGWHNSLFQVLPASFSEIIGRVLYKHLG